MNDSKALFQLAKEDFKSYCYLVHRRVWKPGRMVSFLCETIQNFVQENTGHAYDILVLSVPPQHGKSMTITETFPSWYLVNYPARRVIEISYSEDFAQTFGRKNRRKIEEFGKDLGVSLSKSTNSVTEFETEIGGGMISRGVMSGVTGRPADLMIIDDPIKNRSEADSETYRERLWSEWQDSFKTRLAAGAKVIVIQTRWHEDDLAGRIAQREKHVKVINLPCEAEENDPLGRKAGEALCPEIGKDDNWLKEMKESYDGGSRTWNALYQGHPSTAEGNIIMREWWKRFDEAPECRRIVISVDAAFKGDNTSDFVAITVWGKTGSDIYLLDMVHRKMDFVDTTNAIIALANKYPNYSAIYIEEKANGAAIINVLRRKLHAIIKITPLGGKIARVNAISGIIEAGNVHIPKTSWGDDLIEECALFPRAAHDDMVDSMSQCLMREYHRSVTNPKMTIKRSRQYEFWEESFDSLGTSAKISAF